MFSSISLDEEALALGQGTYHELWPDEEKDLNIALDDLEYSLAEIRKELLMARMFAVLAEPDTQEFLRSEADRFVALAHEHARQLLGADPELFQRVQAALTTGGDG